MNQKISSHGLTALGALVGAVAGFIYYQQVGCTSEGCFISSHPLVTMGYGAMVFGLAASGWKKPRTPKTDGQDQETE